MSPVSAIIVEHVSKKFRLYHRPTSGLKAQALSRLLSGSTESPYEEFWALRDISLTVRKGETVGLIGPNGSGKSTLLQVIAGIYFPDEGRVAVNGRLRALLELGTGFNPELSGRENVFLNGALMGFPRGEIRKRFDAIIDFAELEQFIDMPLKTYSSGMQMRLGFAIAVHLDPEVLILDEVLAVGDDHFYRKCLRRVYAIKDSGASILFVSHGLGTVEDICDRVCLLQKGRLVAEGSAVDILSHYRAMMAANEAAVAEESREESGDTNELRWGSGAVRIRRVIVCGPLGETLSSLTTGQPFALRIEFYAVEPVDRPVFGISIRRDDGTLVTGPNTKMSHYPISKVDGEGIIEYRAEKISLIPGNYSVAAAVYDEHLLTPYDHWERCARFAVLEGGTGERFGVLTLDGHWELTMVAQGKRQASGEGTPGQRLPEVSADPEG